MREIEGKERFLAFMQQTSTFSEIQDPQSAFAHESIQSFLSTRPLRTKGDCDAFLAEFAPYLTRIDTFHAGMLALLCGSTVERGGDLSIPFEHTMNLLVHQLRLVKALAERNESFSPEDTFRRYAEEVRAEKALPLTIPAAMTMLCRDKERRKQWQQRTDVVELVTELEQAGLIPYYLERVFTLLDDKELLILDPTNRRAFLTRLIGVQNVMYHCYALLQDAILQYVGPGYLNAAPTDPQAVRYAKNDHLTPADYQAAGELSDYQRFNFTYPGGLFFPGSAPFEEVPTLGGMPFLIIEPKRMHFQWDPANMYPVLHEALQARIEIVRELSHEELAERNFLSFFHN
uniref:Uncharacterized protein n=1 Tax=Thermosporothrix sp. COM3 TaxID=2490863 RepID=A0A455SI25_9CHLR|nr:hypothetical protein KTC_13300 [Thermosporothrix sp. COM3]